ncbi:MAG TPA: hypothetical protein PLQ00_14470, partial [Thermoguttaceae bacterium]|nr:hypothetical protein [Thermoguttaceae bacterium]
AMRQALAAMLGQPRICFLFGAAASSPDVVSVPRMVAVRIMSVRDLDGQQVEDAGHLINLVGTTPVGKKVPIVLFRDRKVVPLQVILADREPFLSPKP